MRQVGRLLKPRNWSLLLKDPVKAELRFEIVVGEGAELLKGQCLRLGEGIAGWVAETGESACMKLHYDQIASWATKGSTL